MLSFLATGRRTAEQTIPTVAADYQEEDRGADREGVHEEV